MEISPFELKAALAATPGYSELNPLASCTEMQYFLDGEEYKLHLKLEEGTIRSKAVAGFVIPVRAVFDRKVNLEALKGMME